MNRIKMIREQQNITQSKFAEILNVTSSYISQAERGDKVIGRDLLLKLRENFGISIDWFLTGEGPMFIDQIRTGFVFDESEPLSKSGTVPDLKTEPGSDLPPSPHPPNGLSSKVPTPIRIVKPSEVTGKHFLVPLLDQAVSAGRGADLPESDDVVSYIPAPSYLSRYGNDVAALKVRGDSMEPTLKDGDLVVCDTYGWQGDGIYVIRMDGEGFVKRLSRRPGRMVVHSDNTAYLPFEESIESQALNVVGKVRCAVRKME